MHHRVVVRRVSLFNALLAVSACQVAPSTGSQFADESSGDSSAGSDGTEGDADSGAGTQGATAVDAGSDGAGDEETSAGDTGVAESNGGTPQICGNDVAEGTEECDMTDFGFRDCQTYGFVAGDLTCKDDCTVDASSCSAESICGDDMISGLEQCEEGDLAGATCESLDAGSGELACTPACTFDATACTCKGQGEGCVWHPAEPSNPGGCCPAGIKGNEDGICHYSVNGAYCI